MDSNNNNGGNKSSKKVVILGAGISGLTAAFQLNKQGFDVIILEKNKQVGGSVDTLVEKGFIFDRGPNSGLETSPIIQEIVKDLGIEEHFVYADRTGNKRYIMRSGKLHPLPMSPQAFLSTKLFSTSAKLRLLLEPAVKRSKDGYYQSIAQFVKRRLGQEFLDYAINPFVAGVYAGNPEDLSVHSAFPKLYELEEKYGGLFIGTIRGIRERKKRKEVSKQSAKMFSFDRGMKVLPEAIAAYFGGRVKLQCEVTSLEKNNGGYKITYLQNGKTESLEADYIVSTIPAYAAAEIFQNIDAEAASHMNNIYYPPVLVLYLAYPVEKIGQPLDGFGFLIPAKEKKSYLGAIWSSVLFPHRANDKTASFTLFIGGARNPEVGNMDKDMLFKEVIGEFKETMKISGEPVYMSYKFWQKAIPQYNIGYIEHERYFDEFEKKHPGIIIGGNYRGGISIGDCIKNSAVIRDKILNL